MGKSLYIHIPFCRKRCRYCNFYSTIYKESLASSYVDSLLKQIENLEGQFSTIYIGGGTPTALDRRLLGKLLKGLKRGIKKFCEFTVEANPESLDEEKIKLFLDFGINRISIGVQSLSDQKLQKLGRMHTSREGLGSICLSYKKGFKNISVDLIFGVWGEDLSTWEKEVKEAARLPITHVSCYGLSYENNTPLFSAVKDKIIEPLEDEAVALMYERAIDSLSASNFQLYEVSNFSKKGYPCRHNLNYWENNSYVGLGSSAVSYVGGFRKRNISSIEEYIMRVASKSPLVEHSEKLSTVRSAGETAAIKIRTGSGIDFRWFREKTGFDFLELWKDVLPKLIGEGFIKYKKENGTPCGICLERKGLLFCDTVSSAFL